MNFRLKFGPSARRELKLAVQYYENRSVGLGYRFRIVVEAACAKIASNPRRYGVRRGDYRRANLSGFPYFIAFYIEGDSVSVVAVAHNRRAPDYWRDP